MGLPGDLYYSTMLYWISKFRESIQYFEADFAKYVDGSRVVDVSAS